MTFPLSAGDMPPADDLNGMIAPGWTSFTPTWTVSAGSVSIGNGTLAGRYRQVQGSDTLIAQFRLIAGSTTTYGSGFWIFAPPITPSTNAVNHAVGCGYINDSGTQSRICTVRFVGATGIVADTGTGVVTNSSPQTWATNDELRFVIEYDPA